MNFRLTLHVLGGLLIFLGATLLAPIPFSIYYRDGELWAFIFSALITSLTGVALFRTFHSTQQVTLREGFAIVTFAWAGFALFGSLPYIFSGSLLNPVDAFFESMSGFTTTGASVITDIESNAKSVLFWRALTQWIGGMGFIVLGVAILPLLGVGGMQLYEAEAPGPTTERLTPRIQDTARLLWGVYALLTLLGIGLLWIGEMSFFEAVCHTLAGVATGGFSTRNGSLAEFGSCTQVVMTFLMAVAGVSFSLHYYALRGRVKNYWKSGEFRFYLSLLAGVTLIIFLSNWRDYDSFWLNLRDASFTVTSIMTTTGFVTADYETWPLLSQGLLVAIMFVGGCAGSTAGGMKQVRLVLLVKHAALQVSRLIHPRQIKALKLDRRPVSQDVMQDVLGFTVLFLGVVLLGWLLLALAGVDLVSGASAVISAAANVGPGLGEVGPLDNYAALPWFAKLVLSLVMLLGRLEISTVLVLLFVTFWKK